MTLAYFIKFTLIFLLARIICAQIIRPAAVTHVTGPFQSQQQQQFMYSDYHAQKMFAQNLLLMRGCPARPRGCTLNCANGFAWGLSDTGQIGGGAACLCVCQTDACINKLCGVGEVCISNTNSSSTCISLGIIRRQFLSELQQLADSFSSQTDGKFCPLLLGGMCRQRCESDADCHKNLGTSLSQLRIFTRCCNNGCGNECVLAPLTRSLQKIAGQLAADPIRGQSYLVAPSQPIVPLGGNAIGKTMQEPSNVFVKSGSCPPVALLRRLDNCVSECVMDAECSGVEKCCETSCGHACAIPEKASNCVHLLSALERLPERSLRNGFVPSCSPRGNFNPVQCDEEFCWCVGSESGHEIYGTKKPRSERALLNCREIRDCAEAIQHCAHSKRNKCTFGFRTNVDGCPTADCTCRDLCDGIRCEREIDKCQLVEPDCARPPCAPVPKCLLNPCPNGSPMTLPNGVTALCKQPAQCWDGFWCHQVGFNGLGFCCPDPKAKSRHGTCQSLAVARQRKSCSSECRVDDECPSSEKCCFDGCGLKCTPNRSSNGGEQRNATSDLAHDAATDAFSSAAAVQKSNKQLLASYPKLAKCPSESRLNLMLKQRRTEHGEAATCNECRTDGDCPGLQLCCTLNARHSAKNECRICVYSQSTTKCLHQAITYDFYTQRSHVGDIRTLPMHCAAPLGDYMPIQCGLQFCYCVDPVSGAEIAGTRTPVSDTPKSSRLRECETLGNEPSNACPLRRCDNVPPCAFAEFLRDAQGCATCECVNPCANLQCQADEICILAKVDCVNSNCARQPRCISNICPRGSRPFLSSARGAFGLSTPDETPLAEQCSDTCPIGYHCRNVGLPGEGGICCANTASNQKNFILKCPQQSVLFLQRESNLCLVECRADSDCDGELQVCCFNGCGMRCLSLNIEKKIEVVSRPNELSPTIIDGTHAAGGGAERPGECGIPASRAYNHAQPGETCTLQNTLLGRNRAHGAITMRAACTHDGDCGLLQKCCPEACSNLRKCQFPQKNTACLHLKAAYLQSGAADFAMNLRCTFDGDFSPIQCGWGQCWCVNKQSGIEIEGTRTLATETPVCSKPKSCEGQRCSSKKCLHGFEKDERGCDTCECANPCKRLKCPENLGLICIPEKVECTNAAGGGDGAITVQCPYVPKCMPNVCGRNSGADSILIRRGTFRPESCERSTDCPPNYYCRGLGGLTGVCCFGNEPARRSGRCPMLNDWAFWRVEPEFCQLQCSSDADCTNPTEKCCFNGCGLSCIPSLPGVVSVCHLGGCVIPYLVDENQQHAESRKDKIAIENGRSDEDENRRNRFNTASTTRISKLGECPNVDAQLNAEYCESRALPLKSCTNDAECSETQKCCASGCGRAGNTAKVCVFSTIATRCQQIRAAALLILRTLPNNIFLPTCTINGDFNSIQRHNGIAWCVDPTFGMEIYGTKSAAILLTNCNQIQQKSCPILACSLDCPYGFETDLLGCKLCSCRNPCLSVRCGPYSVCQMTRVKCLDKRNEDSCFVFVPRCIVNVCQLGEPLQDVTTRRLFDCDERKGRNCPAGWYCNSFGYGESSYCCKVTAAETAATSRRNRRCLNVEPLLGVVVGEPLLVQNTVRGLTCRMDDECTGHRSCCFNGHDMSCVMLNDGDKEPNESRTSSNEMSSVFGPINDDSERSNHILEDSQNLCKSKEYLKRDEFQNIRRCSSKDTDCGLNAKCRFAKNTITGVCCVVARDEDSTANNTNPVPIGGMVLSKTPNAGICPSAITPRAGRFASAKSTELPKLFDEIQMCAMGNECDTDADCSAVSSDANSAQKCCTVDEGGRCRRRACVQPFRATNCLNMLAAIMQLQKRRILHNLYTPYCDTQEGNYRSNQCDDSEGWCWCVDEITGRPLLATRTLQPTFDVCKLASSDESRRCSITCDAERMRACPFGVEMDKSGCPRSSHCRCRSPCADVRCPRDEVCVMRARVCQERVCLPVPTCEPNPCSGDQTPARSSKLGEGALAICINEKASDRDLMNECPVEHFCTAIDNNGFGICCPGKEAALSTASNKQSTKDEKRENTNEELAELVAACLDNRDSSTLPNLIDYFRSPSDIRNTNDDEPADDRRRVVHCGVDAKCHITHFCATLSSKNHEQNGVCCPSSQFICAQPMNAGYGSGSGNCERFASSRFYFDATADMCVQFIYGGCGGNLNNFLFSSDCEAFCLGTPLRNASAAAQNDVSSLVAYDVGFLMKGSALPPWSQEQPQRKRFEATLRDYVVNEFGEKDKLRDVNVNVNGTTTLTFGSSSDPNASRRVAQRVFDAISDGEFKFPFDRITYSAIASSVFSRQRYIDSFDESDRIWDTSGGGTLFWIITMASLLFGLIVVIILCSAYNFLRLRSTASVRDESVSPTSYNSGAGSGGVYRQNPSHLAERHNSSLNTTSVNYERGESTQAVQSPSIPSTARHLKVISLPHQPQTHLLTISNYNTRNSTSNASGEARITSSRFGGNHLLLTPAAKTMDVSARNIANASSPSTSSAEDESHNRNNSHNLHFNKRLLGGRTIQ